MQSRTEGAVEGLIEIRPGQAKALAAYEMLHRQGSLGTRRESTDRLLRWLELRPGLRFLDVACGEGTLVAAAAARGVEAHGVDFSLTALRRVRHGMVVAADGEALPYSDDYFDRVASIGSLEHYERPLVGAKELARVLRPEGRALILLPNTFGLRWNVLYAWRHGDVCDDGQPIQRYGTLRQWSRLLEAAGLRIENVIGYEGELRPRHLLASLRHPSRWLIPAARWLPTTVCSMLVFVCGKSPARPGQHGNAPWSSP